MRPCFPEVSCFRSAAIWGQGHFRISGLTDPRVDHLPMTSLLRGHLANPWDIRLLPCISQHVGRGFWCDSPSSARRGRIRGRCRLWPWCCHSQLGPGARPCTGSPAGGPGRRGQASEGRGWAGRRGWSGWWLSFRWVFLCLVGESPRPLMSLRYYFQRSFPERSRAGDWEGWEEAGPGDLRAGLSCLENLWTVRALPYRMQKGWTLLLGTGRLGPPLLTSVLVGG